VAQCAGLATGQI